MSEKIIVAIDEEGNLLLPSTAKKRLHLPVGATLVVEDAPKGNLRLRVQHPHSILENKEGVIVAKVQAWGQISDVVKRERERRVFDLIQRVGT